MDALRDAFGDETELEVIRKLVGADQTIVKELATMEPDCAEQNVESNLAAFLGGKTVTGWFADCGEPKTGDASDSGSFAGSGSDDESGDASGNEGATRRFDEFVNAPNEFSSAMNLAANSFKMPASREVAVSPVSSSSPKPDPTPPSLVSTATVGRDAAAAAVGHSTRSARDAAAADTQGYGAAAAPAMALEAPSVPLDDTTPAEPTRKPLPPHLAALRFNEHGTATGSAISGVDAKELGGAVDAAQPELESEVMTAHLDLLMALMFNDEEVKPESLALLEGHPKLGLMAARVAGANLTVWEILERQDFTGASPQVQRILADVAAGIIAHSDSKRGPEVVKELMTANRLHRNEDVHFRFWSALLKACAHRLVLEHPVLAHVLHKHNSIKAGLPEITAILMVCSMLQDGKTFDVSGAERIMALLTWNPHTKDGSSNSKIMQRLKQLITGTDAESRKFQAAAMEMSTHLKATMHSHKHGEADVSRSAIHTHIQNLARQLVVALQTPPEAADARSADASAYGSADKAYPHPQFAAAAKIWSAPQ